MKHVIFFMAGGNSRRFHANKLMSKIQDRYLFEYGLNALLELKQSRPDDFEIVVITQYEALAKICRGKYGEQLQVVIDPSCTQGISYTIKAALNAAQAEDYTFLAADQPFVQSITLINYFQTVEKRNSTIFGYSHEGTLYNPMTFAYQYRDELLSLQADQGGKRVAKKHPDQIVPFPISNPDEIADIDCQEDFEYLGQRLHERLDKK